MCIEDVRLGRKKRQFSQQVSITSVLTFPPQLFLPPNPRRTLLYLNGQGSTIYIFTGFGSAGYVIVDLITSAINFRKYTVEEFGQLVTGSWLATAVGGVAALSVTEAWLDEQ